MKDKMTKKDWFETISAFLEESSFEPKEEALNFLRHEIELLNKKSSSGKKTKNQKENEEVKKLILVALELFDKPVTVSTMIKENSEMSKLSSQKLSALLKQLIESGEVVRTVEKRVPYFSLAKEEEEEEAVEE
jgi:DNA-binding HxlR family transcriptional regulator